ncbi:MAG: metallophosphoesterase [Candidatus Acidiferrales bacterium]
MKLRRMPIFAAISCVVLAAFAFRSNAQEHPSGHTQQSAPRSAAAHSEPALEPWTFAVSGDSRNCGDVVMPAIAAGVRKDGARFYWHLGDFRAIYNFDEDIGHQPERLAKPLNILGYEDLAWNDFIENQLLPFGALPVFLAIGNHETIPPRTREQYLIQFADWLDTPLLRKQRLSDDGQDFKLRSYYHWIKDGVDFITLDNATPEQFDSDQLAWFEKVLHADSANPQIHTIVAGMHKPLPESISKSHGMNESASGTESGRRAYADLLNVQNGARKRVYVLQSHSHYFMEGIFHTDYWQAHGGVLPGWIVGTAGAQRNALPMESSKARASQTDVYGFLLGRVNPDGDIDFAFQPLTEADVPATVASRYGPDFLHWCFAENSAAH